MSSVYDRLKTHPNPGRRLIGIEVERFLIKKRPLRYEPDVRKILEALVEKKGWASSYEVEGKLLAITKDGHGISIEPGGQFEVSSGPQESVGSLKEVKDGIDVEVEEVLPSDDISFLSVGLNPWDSPGDITLLPSPRYSLMNSHFEGTGKRGKEMMRLSLGLQINLDIDGERVAVNMLRAGFYAAPALSALFSNSPYAQGKKTGRLSERHFVWRDTDPARSGFPDFIFDSSFDLKTYSTYVSRTPLMYAFDRDGKVWDPEGKCLDELDPELREVNTMPAIRQIFTEVRLKPCCVEVRYFDQVPGDLRYAATGMTVGLLYDEENLAWLNKKYSGVKSRALMALMKTGAETGMANDEIYAAAKELLAVAEKGLVRRGLGEENFLSPAEALIRERTTPAETLDFKI